MISARLPLFPLRTVLFPEGVLQLRLFEPRYLSMVGRCLKDGGGFGVVLARTGTGKDPLGFHAFGTACEISDWDQGDDGLLHIEVHGRRRFTVRSSEREPDGLIVGDIDYMDSDWGHPLADDDAWLAELVHKLSEGLGQAATPSPERLDDAAWISYRLSELLPLVPAQRQALLQMDDVAARLSVLRQAIRLMEGGAEGSA